MRGSRAVRAERLWRSEQRMHAPNRTGHWRKKGRVNCVHATAITFQNVAAYSGFMSWLMGIARWVGATSCDRGTVWRELRRAGTNLASGCGKFEAEIVREISRAQFFQAEPGEQEQSLQRLRHSDMEESAQLVCATFHVRAPGIPDFTAPAMAP